MKDFLMTNLGTTLASIISIAITTLLASLVNWLFTKAKKIRKDIKSSSFAEAYDFIEQVIFSCVNSTNQTYVDTLKKKGLFDDDAKKEAFDITYSNVYKLVNEQAAKLLKVNTEDDKVKDFLSMLIENTIRGSKDSSISNTIDCVQDNNDNTTPSEIQHYSSIEEDI